MMYCCLNIFAVTLFLLSGIVNSDTDNGLIHYLTKEIFKHLHKNERNNEQYSVIVLPSKNDSISSSRNYTFSLEISHLEYEPNSIKTAPNLKTSTSTDNYMHTTTITARDLTQGITTDSTARQNSLHFAIESKNGALCFIMDAKISIFFKFYDNNNEHEMLVHVPTNAQLNVLKSRCGSNNSDALISFQWQMLNGTASFDLTISTSKTGVVAITQMVFFGIINGIRVMLTNNNLDFQLTSNPKKSYLCDVPFVKHLDKKSKVNFEYLKLQAFSLQGNSYSSDIDMCSQMLTTALPMSSDRHTSSATTSNIDIILTKSRHNRTFVCFKYVGKLRLSIPYTQLGDKKAMTEIDVPSSLVFSSTTKCAKRNSTIQVISLDFYEVFTLRMVFIKQEDGSYVNSNFSIIYTTRGHYFPQAISEKTFEMHAVGSKLRFKHSADSFYSCNSIWRMNVGDITVLSKELSIQAFREDGQFASFIGKENVCLKDKEVDNIVPIAVGAALAALLLVVLIAYIMGRQRNHNLNDYQSF